MPKKYQIVLQFPAKSVADFDEIIAFEITLIERLGTTVEVDGHDCGSGEMNIFVFADDPKQVFTMIRAFLPMRKTFVNLVAAYREATGEQYTVLWPDGYDRPFKIA